MRAPSLNAFVYFEAVARHSRVSTAADEIGVSTSAVSQRIKSLEASLGVRLFRRVKRRLILTVEGERLYQSTSEALSILRGARGRVSLQRDSYKLSLRVSPSYGDRWLGPRLTQFISENPNWELHVNATPELTDFEKENVDLDVRYGAGDWNHLYTELVLSDAVLPLCAPGYLTHPCRSRSQFNDALSKARLIHTVKSHMTWECWSRYHDCAEARSDGGLRFDRASMSLQAARDGAGIVLETAALAFDDLCAGTLIPMYPKIGVLKYPAYWLICPSRHLSRRPAAVFRDWLLEKSKEHEEQRSQLLASLGCKPVVEIDPDAFMSP